MKQLRACLAQVGVQLMHEGDLAQLAGRDSEREALKENPDFAAAEVSAPSV